MRNTPEHEYIIVGPDGDDYGPLTFGEMQNRIAAGEITGRSFVRRLDRESWATAAEFPELGVKDVVVSRHDRLTGRAALEHQRFEARCASRARRAAVWFLVVALLSVANGIREYLDLDLPVSLGLAWGEALRAWVAETRPLPQGALAMLNGVGVIFGLYFAMAGRRRAFTVFALGFFLYLGDTVLTAVAQNWINTGVHLFILLFLYYGLRVLFEHQDGRLHPASAVAWGAAMMIMIGSGIVLGLAGSPRVKAMEPESWSRASPGNWPRLVLGNVAQFRGHTDLRRGTAFLLELADDGVVAATARTLLGAEGGVEPALELSDLWKATTVWELQPAALSTNTVAITGLWRRPSYYRRSTGWLLLGIEREPKSRLPARVLRVRPLPVQNGERVYVVAMSAELKPGHQRIEVGAAKREGRGVLVHLEAPASALGLVGAPLLDVQGHVLGLVTGLVGELDSDGKVATLSGRTVDEVLTLLQ